MKKKNWFAYWMINFIKGQFRQSMYRSLHKTDGIGFCCAYCFCRPGVYVAVLLIFHQHLKVAKNPLSFWDVQNTPYVKQTLNQQIHAKSFFFFPYIYNLKVMLRLDWFQKLGLPFFFKKFFTFLMNIFFITFLSHTYQIIIIYFFIKISRKWQSKRAHRANVVYSPCRPMLGLT